MIPARSVIDVRRGNAGCVESEEASFSDEPTWPDFDEATGCLAPGLFAFGSASLATACNCACGFDVAPHLPPLTFVWAVVVFGGSEIFAVPGAFSVGAEVADARLEYVVETNVELFTVFFVWATFDVVGLLIEL